MLVERYIKAAAASKKPRSALCACATCGEASTEEVPWDTDLGDLIEVATTCDCGEYLAEVIALEHGDLAALFGGNNGTQSNA